MPPLSLVVIQPTSFCNLDCKYCYVPTRTDSYLMSDEVLSVAFQQIFESELVGDQIEILYHAGEPLAAGLAFYRKAIEIANRANTRAIKVTHSIQTNGTLVNREWATLFLENDFDIGISLDGHAFIHDRNRLSRSGRPSHEPAVKGLRILQDVGLYVGAICVVTDFSLKYPDEIFDFFIDHNIPSLGFNIEETENDHQESVFLADPGKWEKAYSDFFSRIFQRQHSSPHLRVREFIETFDTAARIRHNPAYYRRPVEARDFGMITINKHGKVTTYCPEFAGLKNPEFNDFIIGDIMTQSLTEMFNGDPFIKLRKEIHKSIFACASSCPFFEFCGGTNFSNKFAEHRRLDVTMTSSCRLHRQTIIRTLLEEIESNS